MQNQKMSITAQVALGLLITNLTAIGTIALVSYWTSMVSLKECAANLLKGIQKSKQVEVQSYFQLKKNEVKALAGFPFVVSAMRDFKEAHPQVVADLALSPEQLASYKQKLKDYYDNEFIKKLNMSVDKPERTQDYFPQSDNAVVLQNFYIIENSYPLGSKDKLNEHSDASAYSKFHAQYHPLFHDYLQKFNFYDLFLIDPETLTIVYTVFKEVDFANSFKVQGLEKTIFKELIEKIRASETKEIYALIDFAPYGPSYAAPAAFAAVPIFDQDKLIGILAAQLPIDELEGIVTDHKKWQEVGLGKTGETFLVGKDYLLRSNPRLFLEKPTEYFNVLEALSTPARTIDRIRVYNTAILLQEVTTQSVKLFVQGQNGVIQEKNWRDLQALSAYTPLDIPDLSWGMVTTMETAEMYAPVGALKWPLLIFIALFIIFLGFVFFVLARSIKNSLHALYLSIEHLNTLPLEQANNRGELGKIAELIKKMIGEQKQARAVKNKMPELSQAHFSDQIKTLMEQQSHIKNILTHIQLLKGDVSRALENSRIMLTKMGSVAQQSQPTTAQFFDQMTTCSALSRKLEALQHELRAILVQPTQEKSPASGKVVSEFEDCTVQLVIALDRLRAIGQSLKNTLDAQIVETAGTTTAQNQVESAAKQLDADIEMVDQNLNEQSITLHVLYTALQKYEKEIALLADSRVAAENQQKLKKN